MAGVEGGGVGVWRVVGEWRVGLCREREEAEEGADEGLLRELTCSGL